MEAVVLDACVLYPAALRDFLMRLAVRLYQPKWTNEIHNEWIRNVLGDRPDLTMAQLTRTRDLMDRHGGACLVTEYEDLIPTLALPDQDDRHVLAAAIKSSSTTIVTFNLAHFPKRATLPHGVTAVHPDSFTVSLYAKDPQEFVRLARLHRLALVNPKKTAEEYLATLVKCGLPKTVDRLRLHLSDL
jgi:hypothetical protein